MGTVHLGPGHEVDYPETDYRELYELLAMVVIEASVHAEYKTLEMVQMALNRGKRLIESRTESTQIKSQMAFIIRHDDDDFPIDGLEQFT